jgi:hypothetical protein
MRQLKFRVVKGKFPPVFSNRHKFVRPKYNYKRAATRKKRLV